MLPQPSRQRTHYLWPENVAAWSAWQDLQTQWRHGMGGATGLDYAGVRAYLDEQGIAGDERRDIWQGLRAAEAAALDAMAKRQASESRR